MSRRKKNPYRWYVFSLWLIGTAAAVYGAYSYEWATTPHTPQEIEWYRERFGNLEPEFSYTRVGIYSAFASLVIYMVIQCL